MGAPLVRREGKRTHLTRFGTAMLRPFKKFVDVARKTELQAQEFLHGTTQSIEKRIRSLPLYDEPLVVAHSTQHPFCARESVSLEEVFREPYLDRTQCEFRHMFSQNVGGSPNVTVLSDNEFWIQSLIRENIGVSIMPKELLLLDGLQTTLIDGDKIRRTVSLVVPTGREDTLDIRNFLQVAREFCWSDVN